MKGRSSGKPLRRQLLLLGLAAPGLLVAACAAPAAQDDAEARFAAGMRLHLEKRYAKSRPVFESLAADGHVRSQFMLGTIHEQGLGVPKDLAAAAFWYEKAGRRGDDSAQYNLGILYRFGRGVAKDPVAAARWLGLAANQGHSRAQNSLSTFYYAGVGVERDLAEAWKWLTLSADRLKGQGRRIALENRVVFEREMTAAQLAEANRRVAAWRGSHKR
jgi:TPR repeat protein